MNYTLFGSQTSPFVRRIRILFENIPFEFKELNIFETEDGITLNKINPINQVPVFLDGEQKIWDSRQIFNYINLHHKIFNMTWDDENLLTAIDSAMSSGVNLLLMKRSGMKIDEPLMFVNRQKERIESVLDYLKPYLKDDALKDWNFITISLYCFLDWATFRSIVSLENRPECVNFLKHYAHRSIVLETAIPKV
jgi:glutathione S-transferase